ncbi:MAG: serine/threonine-protein kinase [Paracoccus sp. (in: a-proteobacteria)]|nr:serine/threonine-protein kinase [Paracoccus sp. (in: a-proteobacteria)]
MSDEPAPDDDKTRLSGPPDPAVTVLSDRPRASAAPAEIVPPGTLINNNYRIIELVSAGGMGEVYRGENIFTGDPVAIKIILPALARDRAVIDLFMREARVLVQLRDDAIVHYHNFVLDQGLGRYCLIMEFVAGQHLLDRLKTGGPLSSIQAVQLLRRIGGGLARAHARGVIHRDLSPDNVILRDDSPVEAVLIDFGIAYLAQQEDGLGGRFAGKYRYVAPEQLAGGEAQTGPRTDIYSLALLIAATLRGEPLPMGSTAIEAVATRQAVPDLSGIPHDLFPLLQYMLQPDPAQRPADLVTVLRALDDPALIPSRFRLPLWTTDAPAEVAGNVVTTGALSLPQTSAPDSSSPFPVSWGGDVPVAAAPPPARRRVWPLAIPALLTVIAAAYALTREQPDAPDIPPLEIAQPAGLSPRDPTTREGFLASYPLPACTLATRLTFGPDTGTIRILSPQDYDPEDLAAAYQNAFGATPAVQTRIIASGICAAVDFLAELSGRGGPTPVLHVVTEHSDTGTQIVGRITGADNRSLWLTLATPDGELHDLTRQITNAPGADPSFGFALTGVAGDAATYLLIAMTTETPLPEIATLPSIARAETALSAVTAGLIQTGNAPGISYSLIGSAEDGG